MRNIERTYTVTTEDGTMYRGSDVHDDGGLDGFAVVVCKDASNFHLPKDRIVKIEVARDE